MLTRFAKLFELVLLNRLVRYVTDGGRLYRIQEIQPDGKVRIRAWPAREGDDVVTVDPGELETG